MEAFSSFFEQLNRNAQKKYHYLFPEILSILPTVRNSTDEDHLTRALLSVIVLAEFAPKLFKDQFHDLVTFSMGVVKDKDLGDTVRQNALELMATFADNAPAMCKKDPTFTTEMVMQCLALMTDVGVGDEDAGAWNEAEDVRPPPNNSRTCVSSLTCSSLTKTRVTPTTWLANKPWTDLPTSLAAQHCSHQPSSGCQRCSTLLRGKRSMQPSWLYRLSPRVAKS